MAAVSVRNTIVTGTPADATEINQNFADLVEFANDDIMLVDGAKALSDDLDGGGFRVKNLVAATAGTDLVRWDQVAACDYQSGAVASVATGGTTIATLSITMPAAGLGFVVFGGTGTCAGVSFPSGVVGMTASYSVTQFGQIQDYLYVGAWYTNAAATLEPIGDMVALAAGLNTITVTGTRVNLAGPSGGTLSLGSDFIAAIIGMC